MRKSILVDKKHILFLTSWYPSRENPSLGNFVVKHAQCASMVADVTVLYAVSSDSVSTIEVVDEEKEGVRSIIVYYPKSTKRIPLISGISKFKNYKLALEEGVKYIRRSIDLVHLNTAFPAGLFALDLKRKKGIPYILLSHWTGYLSSTNGYINSSYFVRRLHQSIFSHAEKVLTVSAQLGESLKSLGLVTDYAVYSNVVDGELFCPNSRHDDSDILRILHVSSCDDAHKNISGMLEAIAGVTKPFHIDIITESSIEHVEAILRNSGVAKANVSIVSRANPAQIGEAFRKNDVFVLFSNYETFSVVLAESWMSGVPAIYSKCGGLTEINDADIGVQVEKGNIAMLTAALNSFEKQNYDSQQIRQFATRFEKKQLSEEIRKIYEEIAL